MTPDQPTGGSLPIDSPGEMRRAVEALAGPPGQGTKPMTSDLSIDEELLLHSIGWEPVELVTGASIFSVPMGVWNWGQGEITSASTAFAGAFAGAIARIHRETTRAGGHGVVGVHVETSVQRHHIDVTLLGTAVRPVGSHKGATTPFVSDLGARDFTVLHVSGWEPTGLAVGAGFVYAPRRSMGTAMQQKSQNVELTNFTEAMYSARESAMERMQASALALRGSGVVDVTVNEGPIEFARHAIGFTAWGTAVRLAGDQHRTIEPSTVVPLDDAQVAFDASTLG